MSSVQLIKEGPLAKQDPGGIKRWQNRYCTLYLGSRGPVLRYYGSQKDLEAKKDPKGEIYLPGSHLVTEELKRANSFGIAPISPQRTYYLSAPSSEECHAWKQAIQKHSNDPGVYESKTFGYVSPAGDRGDFKTKSFLFLDRSILSMYDGHVSTATRTATFSLSKGIDASVIGDGQYGKPFVFKFITGGKTVVLQASSIQSRSSWVQRLLDVQRQEEEKMAQMATLKAQAKQRYEEQEAMRKGTAEQAAQIQELGAKLIELQIAHDELKEDTSQEIEELDERNEALTTRLKTAGILI